MMNEKASIKVDDVAGYLGPVKLQSEAKARMTTPGVAMGLAWTPTGGDLLFIEATAMKGKKGLTLTGQLGDVMRESAQIAHSYVRSKAALLGIKSEDFKRYDVHVHVPAGAIPKDGPSAGIAMAVALVSALGNHPVRHDVAMTGEITPTGEVLPIGGLLEKVLAAHRVGIRQIIIPRANEPDLESIPEEAREAIEFVPVAHVDEVWDTIFPDILM